jgi:hypothetical protein
MVKRTWPLFKKVLEDAETARVSTKICCLTVDTEQLPELEQAVRFWLAWTSIQQEEDQLTWMVLKNARSIHRFRKMTKSSRLIYWNPTAIYLYRHSRVLGRYNGQQPACRLVKTWSDEIPVSLKMTSN